ncbi:hypothetical protein COOONC_01795 [Cooperia oncophora]
MPLIRPPVVKREFHSICLFSLFLGVIKECLSFCKGDVPTCDSQAILNYQPCTQHMSTIMQCQKEGLDMKPRYDPYWSSVCDWEGK